MRDHGVGVEWDAISPIAAERRDSVAMSDKMLGDLLRGNSGDRSKVLSTLKVTDADMNRGRDWHRKSILSCTPRSQFGPALDGDEFDNGQSGQHEQQNNASALPIGTEQGK